MPSPLTIVVTGSNRGLGAAICTAIASSSTPTIIYATSRQGGSLAFDVKSTASKVRFAKLDISDQLSIDALVSQVEQEQGGCDVLINNSGVYPSGQRTAAVTKHIIDVNYRGTKSMCVSFLPIMNPSGRIVNVSSLASSLRHFSAEVQTRFRKARNLADIDALADEFEERSNAGTQAQAGFGHRSSYDISKALVNSMTAVVAHDNGGLLINSCCPGWVSSDMGKMLGRPPKSLDDGARIPVRLALGNIGNVSGKYWANDSMSSAGEGRVQEW